MSADEFDPFIERLFAQTRPMADAAVFQADVEARLSKGSRIRTAALWCAGLVGGVVAVGQVMQADVAMAPGAETALTQIESGSAGLALQSAISSIDLGGLDLASMGGMQAFWLVAGVLAGLAALAAMRLSQQI